MAPGVEQGKPCKVGMLERQVITSMESTICTTLGTRRGPRRRRNNDASADLTYKINFGIVSNDSPLATESPALLARDTSNRIVSNINPLDDEEDTTQRLEHFVLPAASLLNVGILTPTPSCDEPDSENSDTVSANERTANSWRKNTNHYLPFVSGETEENP